MSWVFLLSLLSSFVFLCLLKVALELMEQRLIDFDLFLNLEIACSVKLLQYCILYA